MDLVFEAKQKRLQKMRKHQELHGWLVHDKWIQNKIYKNHETGDYKEVSYVTKDKVNPLPFHNYIDYVGIIHEYKDELKKNTTLHEFIPTYQLSY